MLSLQQQALEKMNPREKTTSHKASGLFVFLPPKRSDLHSDLILASQKGLLR